MTIIEELKDQLEHAHSSETSLNLQMDEEEKLQQQPTEQCDQRAENLQQQLLKDQKDLTELAAKHREEQEAPQCDIKGLKAELCTSEALREQNK